MGQLRLPPVDFILDSREYNDAENVDSVVDIEFRKLHPELSAWNESSIKRAMYEFEMKTDDPSSFDYNKGRRDDFIAFLYAVQVMPIYCYLFLKTIVNWCYKLPVYTSKENTP